MERRRQQDSTIASRRDAARRVSVDEWAHAHVYWISETRDLIDIDEKLAARAVKKGPRSGQDPRSIDHDYVQKLADDDPERWIEEFERLSGRGDSQGQRFDRGEIHERQVIRRPAEYLSVKTDAFRETYPAR